MSDNTLRDFPMSYAELKRAWKPAGVILNTGYAGAFERIVEEAKNNQGDSNAKSHSERETEEGD